MRLIAQRLFPDNSGPTRVRGELVNQDTPDLPLPRKGPSAYHLYCSTKNAGAADFVAEFATTMRYKLSFNYDAGSPRQAATVQGALSQFAATVRGRLRGASRDLQVSSRMGDLSECDHMLVYLCGLTWTSGAMSAAFADEVKAAMEAGVHLLLCHEMAGVDQERRHGCEFGAFFSHPQGLGSTPRELLAAGIYKEVANPLKGSAIRETSMIIVSRALAAQRALTLGLQRDLSLSSFSWLRSYQQRRRSRSRADSNAPDLFGFLRGGSQRKSGSAESLASDAPQRDGETTRKRSTSARDARAWRWGRLSARSKSEKFDAIDAVTATARSSDAAAAVCEPPPAGPGCGALRPPALQPSRSLGRMEEGGGLTISTEDSIGHARIESADDLAAGELSSCSEASVSWWVGYDAMMHRISGEESLRTPRRLSPSPHGGYHPSAAFNRRSSPCVSRQGSGGAALPLQWGVPRSRTMDGAPSQAAAAAGLLSDGAAADGSLERTPSYACMRAREAMRASTASSHSAFVGQRFSCSDLGEELSEVMAAAPTPTAAAAPDATSATVPNAVAVLVPSEPTPTPAAAPVEVAALQLTLTATTAERSISERSMSERSKSRSRSEMLRMIQATAEAAISGEQAAADPTDNAQTSASARSTAERAAVAVASLPSGSPPSGSVDGRLYN